MKRNGLLYKLVMLLLILIIGFSLYKVGTILYGYYQGQTQYEEVQELAGATEEKKPEKKKESPIDFKTLCKENEDVKAWIYSKDTVINYPVVQGPDNDYYLYRMFNGEYNGAGSIFIDYRNEEPFESFNTVMHGHRMKDGTMFKSLMEYRDPDYYKAHKKMKLYTPDAQYDLVIFAAITIPSDSDMYQFYFYSDDDKEYYLNRIYGKTELYTDVEVTADDKIVMMSTCTFEFDDARFCVYGKLVEKE
ncbi:MAG: class B sortase [Firmicutes bacterium]|nr:class B sortase [Bacillota bacterium]